MRSRTFRQSEADDLIESGYAFMGATSNGLLFQKFEDGMIEGALLQQSGRIRRYMPEQPDNRNVVANIKAAL